MIGLVLDEIELTAFRLWRRTSDLQAATIVTGRRTSDYVETVPHIPRAGSLSGKLFRDLSA